MEQQNRIQFVIKTFKCRYLNINWMPSPITAIGSLVNTVNRVQRVIQLTSHNIQ